MEFQLRTKVIQALRHRPTALILPKHCLPSGPRVFLSKSTGIQSYEIFCGGTNAGIHSDGDQTTSKELKRNSRRESRRILYLMYSLQFWYGNLLREIEVSERAKTGYCPVLDDYLSVDKN